MKNIIHEDLEEKFQISADVEFESSNTEFNGIEAVKFEIKKKIIKKINIENVEPRNSGKSNGLF